MPYKVGLAERQALIVAAPIAVGLYAWRDGTHARFGRLLVMAGFLWSITALAGSDDELLYSIGRVAGWFVEAAVVYLVLAFPSGRLTTRIDRALAIAVLRRRRGPVPAHGADRGDLPRAVAGLDLRRHLPRQRVHRCSTRSRRSWMQLVVPLRELLAALLLIAVVVRLADRIRRATRLMRRTLVPVLVAAILRTLALAAAFGIRALDASDTAVIASSGAVALGLPLICLGFLIGLHSLAPVHR